MSMLHAYLDESGIHDGSRATAVIAAVGTPEAWKQFDSEWSLFVNDVGMTTWRHRDFCNRRHGYGALTDEQWLLTRDRLCELLIAARFFIARAAIGRNTYEQARAAGKWRLPADPYKFCLERCMRQVTKRIYTSHRDKGVRIYYDAVKQHGRIARELLRWHRETFEPNHLSQYRMRPMDIEFGDGGIKSGCAVPDILAFEACEYVSAATGIPFLGAKLADGPTPEPRPIIKKLFEAHVPLAVATYTDWSLDLDLDLTAEPVGEPPPKAIVWK